MHDFFFKLLDTSDWPPRWHCGTWSPFHGWLYLGSDLVIWASYFAIPLLLIRLVRRRPDIPFPKLIWLFVAFIISCGTTHLIDAIGFWWPAYRLGALARFITGIVSIAAVYALYKLLPLILSLRTVEELEYEISQRKAAELALNKSHQLLSESHQQLKSFTHILSHNIRNHASNLSLLADLIETDTLTDDNVVMFDKISRVSKSLNHTLNDLSEAIMIRENAIPKDKLSFSDITEKVMEVLDYEISGKNVKISIDYAVDIVMFPRIYLESVIMNLISNAIKYGKPDGQTHVSLKTYYNEKGETVFECSDNGLGIDLNLHGSKIFGLYKTFHNHSDAHGVGLFLVKTQIDSQGGNISVESEVGIGTTFKVEFTV